MNIYEIGYSVSVEPEKEVKSTHQIKYNILSVISDRICDYYRK